MNSLLNNEWITRISEIITEVKDILQKDRIDKVLVKFPFLGKNVKNSSNKNILYKKSIFTNISIEKLWKNLLNLDILAKLYEDDNISFKIIKGQSIQSTPCVIQFISKNISIIIEVTNRNEHHKFKKLILKVISINNIDIEDLFVLIEIYNVTTEVDTTGIIITTYEFDIENKNGISTKMITSGSDKVDFFPFHQENKLNHIFSDEENKKKNNTSIEIISSESFSITKNTTKNYSDFELNQDYKISRKEISEFCDFKKKLKLILPKIILLSNIIHDPSEFYETFLIPSNYQHIEYILLNPNIIEHFQLNDLFNVKRVILNNFNTYIFFKKNDEKMKCIINSILHKRDLKENISVIEYNIDGNSLLFGNNFKVNFELHSLSINLTVLKVKISVNEELDDELKISIFYSIRYFIAFYYKDLKTIKRFVDKIGMIIEKL